VLAFEVDVVDPPAIDEAVTGGIADLGVARSVAGARSPGRRPPTVSVSDTVCAHSFRINGGYTDASIDRLRTAATRRIGAGA
jgi:hypothetical protein